MNTNKKINNKIKKYQNKILKYESKYNLNNKINLSEFINFYKKFNHYKIICTSLYNDPKFYLNLQEIMINNYNNLNELTYLEIIWLNEHYELIEQIRSIESDIKIIIKKSIRLDLISNIQYKLIKILNSKIHKIFEQDITLQKLYNYEYNNITKNELDLYFNIIEIILLKILNNNNNNYITIDSLLNNDKYSKFIDTIKNNMIIKSNLIFKNFIN